MYVFQDVIGHTTYIITWQLARLSRADTCHLLLYGHTRRGFGGVQLWCNSVRNRRRSVHGPCQILGLVGRPFLGCISRVYADSPNKQPDSYTMGAQQELTRDVWCLYRKPRPPSSCGDEMPISKSTPAGSTPSGFSTAAISPNHRW